MEMSPMKVLAIILLLLSPSALRAEKPKPNPADFTVTVHVVRSRIYPPGAYSIQHLDTIIDGMSAELQTSAPYYGVLAPGDYKAQLATTSYIPKNPNGYDIFRVYRLLLPDGTTRDFNLVGLGAAEKNGQP
jgi:hypothetical protein